MNEDGQVYLITDEDQRQQRAKLEEDRQRYADSVLKSIEDFENQFLNVRADELRAELRSRDAESR